MKTIVIGVGDHAATRNPDEAIKTLALGSCVAVIMLEPRSRCVAMAHIALPDSSIKPDRVRDRPAYFADSGVPALLETMRAAGADTKGEPPRVKLVGGANVMDTGGRFNIGKRNVLAIKRALWERGMGPLAEDVGGNYSRTVSIDVRTGQICISSPGRPDWSI